MDISTEKRNGNKERPFGVMAKTENSLVIDALLVASCYGYNHPSNHNMSTNLSFQ